MNKLSKRELLFIGLGLVLVFYIGYLIVGSGPKYPNDLRSTSFYSPLTQSSDALIINYGGSADPNADTVQTQYRFFALDSLPLSSKVKTDIQATLPGYIAAYVQPTFGTTYVHIVKDSIKQKSDRDYSFDFYIDSPETYFHFDTNPGSGIYNVVTQIPWEGIQ